MKAFDCLGTAGCADRVRALLLGSGELGKEVAIELQRAGVEVVAADRYPGAPAMQVAHQAEVFSMLDGEALREVVARVKPDLIIPEVEAIHTETLVKLESEGWRIVPTARAANLTMNREGIRRLAAEELSLPTAPYAFVDDLSSAAKASAELGWPVVMKPIMSSSGKGQSVVRDPSEVEAAWNYAQEGGRAGRGRVIIEGWVPFDYEITLLTVRHRGGTSFCPPIGHRQEEGDYRESWQPQPMTPEVWERSREIAAKITDALGGWGLFGVELFVRGEDVLFSEVSPRPHDTGLVTLISQNLSEFALHARAILGLPIPEIVCHGPSASSALLGEGTSDNPRFEGLEDALAEPGTDFRLFGKPSLDGRRRLGVLLARGDTVETARAHAIEAREKVRIVY